MAYREFVDSAKVLWRAWATYPTVGKVLSKGFENGWLTFESQTECRRLAPIPRGWEDFPDVKLVLLLKAATASKKKPLFSEVASFRSLNRHENEKRGEGQAGNDLKNGKLAAEKESVVDEHTLSIHGIEHAQTFETRQLG